MAFLHSAGIRTDAFVTDICFDQLKTGESGLVPCIVQDFSGGEVLMMAWMNQVAFEQTLASGRMTYYSRSRQCLWRKGETSGHFQYLKALRYDCDADTLLAQVNQVGAACHTGHRSCFFRDVMPPVSETRQDLEVLQEVYDTIADRKEHPKEGSYTNYLFDKGIDKILKKCGEENAEIIIAAKNPDKQELQYEIADYLYHLMVLMAQQGLTWQDITRELADRH
ncbi:MAG: bifunctional phosphoribosyl-AMP cyclohydrolase/phosphoribosyl-ATP diphosphatase HisIE [Lachnospiraceae bacterium]|nr:bifunctional phosphoribosyl-AMP cyclohydrolase/phosphoribosyl-ATP diphosphatase HisIE [Lachnospiraceae bacterium]